VASIDQVSDGRFLFGIGVGWNAKEMEDHGTTFASRARLAGAASPSAKWIPDRSCVRQHCIRPMG
jgi:alkanesulfonate monooxygenase SsuD/methylene tetrahydromethanopterin reductase-like flavin-dependent oxidoreductase (luciferase family)